MIVGFMMWFAECLQARRRRVELSCAGDRSASSAPVCV